ncbi:MAG: sugar ABC transporter permease, partial [Pseudomonadota bacterium]
MPRSTAHLWFIAPALTLMVLILLLPIGIAGWLSFTDYSLGGSGYDYVGWKNYERIFTRSTYEKMFGATFRYVGVVVPLSMALGLGAALLISSLKRWGDLYKTIYFLPVMAALLAMAIVWEFALHPTIGIVNRTLEMGCGTALERLEFWRAGCERTFPLWLTDRDTAIWTV